MRRKKLLSLSAIISIMLLLFMTANSSADYEAVSHVVEPCYYVGDPIDGCLSQCSCWSPADCISNCQPDYSPGYIFQESWSDNIAEYENDGDSYSVIRDWTDEEVVGSAWTDPDFYNWGEDNVSQTGTDWADVIMYFGHGAACCDGEGEGTWGDCDEDKWYSQISMGGVDSDNPPGSDSCIIHSHYSKYNPVWPIGGYWTGHIKLGYNGSSSSRDANFLVLLTCHRGEYCVWKNGGWDGAAAMEGSMNMILAFQGLMYSGAEAADDFETFMGVSCCSHAGDKWVENLNYGMTHFDIAGEGLNNCAVAMGWGKTHAAIEYAIYSYQAFLNLKDKRPPTYTHYYFREECIATSFIEAFPEESPDQG